MGQEIERKFLVKRDHPAFKERVLTLPFTRIRQGYIASSPERVVRVRTCDDQGFLCVKGATRGIVRDEFEYEIPFVDAVEMLDLFCPRKIIKQRYYFGIDDGLIIEIDYFEQLDMFIAEIELPHKDAPYYRPEWLGEDVSHDPQYYNSAIADRLPLN